MTFSAEEAQKAAEELVSLSLEQRQITNKIKDLKEQLLEYCEVDNINDMSWSADFGYVQVQTKLVRKLMDIPVEFKVDSSICPIDTAEKALQAKVSLSKEGKQMLKEEYASVLNLMIEDEKRVLSVVI